MKAKNCILILSLICSVTFLRAQNTTKVTSIEGHEVNWMNQQWDSIHPFLKLYNYDNLGNCIRYEYSSWSRISSTQWEQRRKQYVYEYNANGTLKNEYQENWDTTLKVWKEQNKNEYYYKQNGNLDSVIWKTWDSNDLSFYAYNKFEYSYDAHNNIHVRLSFVPFNGTWMSTIKESFNYDSNNRLITETYSFWDTNNSEWMPVTGKTMYTYSLDGKLETKIDSLRQNIAEPLQPKNYTHYTYDNTGFLIETLERIWWNSTSDWKNNYLYTYTNNANGTVDFMLQKTWNGNTWGNNYREFYSYVPLTGIASKNSVDYKLFPNPTSEYIYIETNEPILKIIVSDMKGQTIKCENAIQGNRINVSNIPNGTYLLRFTTTMNTVSTRIVKW